ncbi:hypothetical protein CDD81_4415 [Ophiocordyceps australis]|uniref:Uncharacterized protein n=1 Tax=Ophiocordyceps australis TaxID=1399860 RepID=A0A2C5YHR5_9HYPO|nr:hypothetical protein CDD81_4415 [Ophiocordyceps australis]
MRPSPHDISKTQFTALLAEYPALIASVSASKPPKPGKQSLAQLDAFRYGDALGFFARDAASEDVIKGHVERLVEWKLRHGKFRPTLMSLVSSNKASLVHCTMASALHTYRTALDKTTCSPSAARSAAIKSLCALRGIGPATASLLLAVHDPARTIFFSDEAFAWLCADSSLASSPKYSAAEYASLADAAECLVARLGVDAVDVEKVAYVILRSPLLRDDDSRQTTTKSKRKPPPSRSPPPAKANDTGLRRSKRLRA